MGDQWLRELRTFTKQVGGQVEAAKALKVSAGTLGCWLAEQRRPASDLAVDGLMARIEKARQGQLSKSRPQQA